MIMRPASNSSRTSSPVRPHKYLHHLILPNRYLSEISHLQRSFLQALTWRRGLQYIASLLHARGIAESLLTV